MTTSSTFRRFFSLRFSVRTLMVVLTVPCLYGGWRVEQAKRQMAAVGELNHLVYNFFGDAESDLAPLFATKQVTIYYDVSPGNPISNLGLIVQSEWFVRTGTNSNDALSPPDLLFHLRHQATAVQIHGPLSPELFAALRRLPHLRVIVKYERGWLGDEKAAQQECVDRVKCELPGVEFQACDILEIVE